jgi:hypothetical protein
MAGGGGGEADGKWIEVSWVVRVGSERKARLESRRQDRSC